MSDQHTAAIRDLSARIDEECDALALMSYHGGEDRGQWYADLGPDGVGQIRALLGLASRLLREQEEALRSIESMAGAAGPGEVRAAPIAGCARAALAATWREGTTEHRFPPPNDDYVMGPGDEVPRYAPEVAPGREGADE